MRRCVEKVRPDTIVHLGDYYEDGQVLAEENPDLVVHQVPGNCDRYRVSPSVPNMLCYPVENVMLYMTHGHKEGVKSGIGGLLAAARCYGAQAALYGHTHIPDCHQEEDGLWVLNPGSSGSGTAGLMETDQGKIVSCRILKEEDLEDFV